MQNSYNQNQNNNNILFNKNNAPFNQYQYINDHYLNFIQ